MSADEETIKPANAGAEEAESKRPGEFTDEVITETDTRPFFFRHVTAIVKFCAFVLVSGMWVCTVFLIQKRKEKEYSPWYCLAASTVITLLEIVWFFSRCVCCKDDGGCCCTCWRVLMWLDNWKKGFLYIVVAVPTFIKLKILAIVCGVLIVTLALLYIIKSSADCRCVGGKKFVRRKKNVESKSKAQPDEEKPAMSSPPAVDDTTQHASV